MTYQPPQFSFFGGLRAKKVTERSTIKDAYSDYIELVESYVIK
jgi:hypothetical protein